MKKQPWLDAAEVFDSWRVVPRVIVFIYLAMLVWLTVYFALKFFAVTPEQRTTQLTAFASVLLTAAYGAFGWIAKIYMDGGRDWDAPHRLAAAVTINQAPP